VNEAAETRLLRLPGVDVDEPDAGGAAPVLGPGWPEREAGASAEWAVTALYEANALALIRLAYLMLGDQASAEDVVQEAFCGLYRRWDRLRDAASAIPYLRSSVLNGSRSVLRHRSARRTSLPDQPPAASAEAVVVTSEERKDVIRAVRRLPQRQREVLVLRFYCDMPDEQIARVMGIRQSTVRSAAHRALEALGRILEEGP
jgi:RNA polymerase sigma-70 factor (sigma-E family)